MGVLICIATLLLLCLFELSYAHQNGCTSAQTSEPDTFSWEKIEPSDDLVWTECFTDKHCARLKVPLDYSNPDGASAAIAMVRIHSGVPHDAKSYRGPVLINPGGPGGSGVDLVFSSGSELSTIIGPEFDIIGFDPRGISRSTPRANFFSSRVERQLFDPLDWTSLNSSAAALSRFWARGTLLGQLAGENDDGSLRFIHTDNTARDMLRIVQKHGRDKLQYWGFSYGSVLGATFAAMFPDNVERLVIDGVVDSENYYATEWSNNLRDTDKVFRSFATGCAAAGPSGCAFHARSANQILANIESLASSLRARPIPVRTATSYGVVDFSLLRNTIFRSLYSPYKQFPVLAQALADLADTGNATRLWQLSTRGVMKPFECGACDATEHQFESVIDSMWAVLCNDGARISPHYEDLDEHYLALSKTSSFADQWEIPRMVCLGWPEFPKTNFQGPFIANTSFPLLIVGNTADPVTPLWSAHKMSKGFAGSVVLTQGSAGHCSLSGPSVCTQKNIRAYFLDGKLPEPGTVCNVDKQPFPVADSASLFGDDQAVLGVTQNDQISEDDKELFEAVHQLAMNFEVRMF